MNPSWEGKSASGPLSGTESATTAMTATKGTTGTKGTTALVAFFAFVPVVADVHAEWFPKGDRLFKPFITDHAYPSYTVRMSWPVGEGPRGEINMGDEFSIVSWQAGSRPSLDLLGGDSPSPEAEDKVQLGILGGVAARFDISRITNDLEVADYTFALPLDYSGGKWAARFMYWHTSSHIGDDYIKRHAGFAVRKNTTDEIRLYLDREFFSSLRIYGGVGYAMILLPHRHGRNRFQAGLEWQTKPAKDSPGGGGFFSACDFQALERMGWQPSFSARAGFAGGGGFSVFLEFFAGHLEYLGFMDRKETRCSLGISFEV